MVGNYTKHPGTGTYHPVNRVDKPKYTNTKTVFLSNI